MKNKHTLTLTSLELLALTDALDTLSAISDSVDDDGTLKKDLKKLDKMLLKNGFKRQYT